MKNWRSAVAAVAFWLGALCLLPWIWTGDRRWLWTAVAWVALALSWAFINAVAKNIHKEK